MTSQRESSKFTLVPNEYIDSLCGVLEMELDLRTIFENPVLGECKKTLFGLAKLRSNSLFKTQSNVNAFLSIYSQFVKSGESDLMVEALRGLKNVIPHAGPNFQCVEEKEILLAVMCSAAGMESKPNVRLEAMNCLIEVCSTYSSLLEPYFTQIYDIVMQPMDSKSNEELFITIKGFEFVLEFCKVILFRMEKGLASSSIKEICILEPLLETIVERCTCCLTRNYHDNTEDVAIKEFNSQKAYLATLILSYLCKIYKFKTASFLVPFIGHSNSTDYESDCELKGIAFTAFSCALHCGELDKYLDESLKHLFPKALQTIMEPQMSRYKESAASLISTALLYYPNLIKTDILRSTDTPIQSFTKYNTECILVAIRSSLGCDPSIDKILSVTLVYFLANPHTHAEIVNQQFVQLLHQLYASLCNTTVANTIISIGNTIQSLIFNSPFKCIAYIPDFVTKIVTIMGKYFQNEDQKLIKLFSRDEKNSSCAAVAANCLLINTCVSKYQDEFKQDLGLFVFSLIDFTHRLIKTCPVFTPSLCMCLEEILLLLISLYNLKNHYFMANMNKVFNFVCDLLFLFSQKMTDYSYVAVPCIVLELLIIVIESVKEKAKSIMEEIFRDLNQLLTNVLPNPEMIIAVNSFFQRWVIYTPSTFESAFESVINVVVLCFNKLLCHVHLVSLSPAIITSFTSILNLFASIIHSLANSTALEYCYQQAELFTKVLCEICFLPSIAEQCPPAIQISAMTLIGHLANMGPRVSHSLQKEAIEEFMEECRGAPNFDVRKMYFYADQSLTSLFDN